MPLFKRVHIIINPAAGSDEPILSILNRSLSDTPIDWAVTVSRQPGEVFTTTRHLLEKGGIDALAVYGGDGSVMEAARALHSSPIPLLILPGGTANIMAKELAIPLDSETAVRLLTEDESSIREIDMGLVNGCPFLIRVNMGILSDMITETSPEMKDRWGQWAYGLTAFKTMGQDGQLFHLSIDGQEFTQAAVALTVTNAGNVGRKGHSFLPGISVSDGWLDLIALDKADILSLLKVTGSVLFNMDSTVLKHWKAREIRIRMEKTSTFLCDDTEETAKELDIKVSPASLKVVVPKNESQ